MNEFEKYDEELRQCKKCVDILRSNLVSPLHDPVAVVPEPIVSGVAQKPIMVIGQAPGLEEYRSGKPYQGQAGKGIRGILAEMGIADFEKNVGSSAVVKCYPGRKVRSKRNGQQGEEDLVPKAQMVRNCEYWLSKGIELTKPRVIITLGGLPLKAYLKLRRRKVSDAKLENYVGKSEQWNEATVVFFAHTSGASRWLNSAENKELFNKAKERLKDVLRQENIIEYNLV